MKKKSNKKTSPRKSSRKKKEDIEVIDKEEKPKNINKKAKPRRKSKKKKEDIEVINKEEKPKNINKKAKPRRKSRKKKEDIKVTEKKEKSKKKKIKFKPGKKTIIITISVIALIILSTGVYFLTKTLTQEEEVCQLYKIMPLGDSITLGSGTETLDGYRKELYTKLNDSGYLFDFVGDYNHGTGEWDMDHEGISGEILSWYRTRLTGPDDFILTRNTPDIILYHMGINNLAKGGDIDQYASELNDSVKVIYNFNENATVILAKIIPTGNDNFNSRVTEFNEEVDKLDDIWKDYNIIIVDMENLLIYPDDYSDQIHPNEEGYKKIADAWYSAIITMMKSCNSEE